MNQPNITCPQCKHAFRLDESLAAPIVESTRKEFESRIAKQASDMAARETAVKNQQAAVEKSLQQIEQQKQDINKQVDEQVAAKLKLDRERIAAEQLKIARREMDDAFQQKAQQVATLEALNNQQLEKLKEAAKQHALSLEVKREYEEKSRELELTVQKRVDESLAGIKLKAKQEAEADLQLKVVERDQTIAAMKSQIEDLKRKAEQGSQQSQGEALEVQLETMLKQKFPRDTIEPVPKGEFGGDVLHRVLTATGQVAGAILWESKRTKTWSDGWLAKLRGDQRAAKADVCAIVSLVVPKGCDGFDLVDGVWVTEPRCALPVAVALRQAILDIASARLAGEGQQTKMELVYQYLTGPRFRQRVNAIVEKFSDLREDLDRERKFITKQWAKREAQIQAVIDSTAGMYGDLQGIAGKSLAEIDGLEPKLLDDQTDAQ